MNIATKLANIKFAADELARAVDAIDNSEIENVDDNTRNILAAAGNAAEAAVEELDTFIPAPQIVYLTVAS